MTKTASLLDLLKQIPDPRGRPGRQYPLDGILGVLILAALHGERSLRGMWLWARARQAELVRERSLHFYPKGRLPGLSTLWYVLEKLEAGELESVLQTWLRSGGLESRLCVDGKTLPGSQRRGKAAGLQVITAVGAEMRVILEQREVPAGDELAAAIQLLEMIPIQGKVVSADAGLLKSPFVHQVVEKKGLHRADQGQPARIAPGHRALARAHPGARARSPTSQQRAWADRTPRSVVARLWRTQHLSAARFQLARRPMVEGGWVRRMRKPLAAEEWQVSEQIWIAGAAFDLNLNARLAAAWLRGHWAIENGVFRLRNVTYDEDRLHGRAIGQALSGSG